MKLEFSVNGNPGYPGFSLKPKDPNQVLPEVVQHIETFVSSACRLNEGLAALKGTPLDGKPNDPQHVQVGRDFEAMLGLADQGPNPYQVIDTEYSNVGAGAPPHIADRVHFTGSTSSTENWYRKTINGSCDQGEVIRLNRGQGTLTVEEMSPKFVFPWTQKSTP